MDRDRREALVHDLQKKQQELQLQIDDIMGGQGSAPEPSDRTNQELPVGANQGHPST